MMLCRRCWPRRLHSCKKKCAELGLNTLLLERKALPRDKVCSGMVMGPMAQGIIEEEFGSIPDEVLTTPLYLLGCMAHAPGVEPELVEQKMPFAWRRELDFWMAQKARQGPRSGIGMALKSGLLAAHSVADATASKRDVAEIYLHWLGSSLNILKELRLWDKNIEEESRKGPNSLVTAFAEGLRATLRVT